MIATLFTAWPRELAGLWRDLAGSGARLPTAPESRSRRRRRDAPRSSAGHHTAEASASRPGEARSPQRRWRFYSPLRTHDFGDGDGAGRPLECRNCGRRFRHDPVARTTWAVGKGRAYAPLERSVNDRWISEQCAGGPHARDEIDSKRLAPRLA